MMTITETIRSPPVRTSKYCRAKKKYMCGSGYLTYPKFLPPTINFFSPNSEVGREYSVTK